MARRGNTFWVTLVVTAPLIIALFSRVAAAHEVGVSRGEYARQGERVLVAVTFAQRELETALPWLASQGKAGPLAFEEHRGRLGQWLVTQLVMTGAGQPCSGSFDGMRLDGDGVAIAAAYRCPSDASEVKIEARFLSELGRGHRHLASLLVNEVTTEMLATSIDSSFVLRTKDDRSNGAAIGLTGYVRMGVEHILTGYDHLLFLLGLVLLGRPIRSLVAAITAFTVAHSITLALAAFDVLAPSQKLIEPCIALSIAYVGIENWFVSDARGRWRITLAFGLVHGFGFAGALREIAVPRPRIPAALLGFNMGVELGQIAALAVLLPLILAARRLDLWQRAGMRACTAAVAATGVILFLVRVRSGT